jgi:hypothetical protein
VGEYFYYHSIFSPTCFHPSGGEKKGIKTSHQRKSLKNSKGSYSDLGQSIFAKIISRELDPLK